MRLTRDQWALKLAAVTARRSTCLRRAVGCVLLDARGHVLATGYNGVAAGLPHCNEPSFDLKKLKRLEDELNLTMLRIAAVTRPENYPHRCPGAQAPSGTALDGCHAIHAEQNALLQCRDVHLIDTCYVTTSPCMTCVKLLLNTSCRCVVFRDEYTQPDAGELWRRAGRDWEKA